MRFWWYSPFKNWKNYIFIWWQN